MIETLLAAVALGLATIPATMFLVNLCFYRRPPRNDSSHPRSAVSVLIPARNEARAIAAALDAALASRGVELEVIVLDDHSEDATAEIVSEIAARDARVRLVRAPSLPPGWCGKQHACRELARHARHDVLVFLDADVRLTRDGLARMVAFLDRSGAALVSGIPRQETATFLEQLLIPLIHFVLLGFLPMMGMRWTRRPSFAAGCGQLFVTRRDAYDAVDGHGHPLVRGSFHDGLTLPRAFRHAGLATDLCDATDVAVCRMYRSAAEVWRGLAKNATEGMASPGAIGPFTVLLAGGQVLPFVMLAFSLPPFARGLTLAAMLLAYLPRLLSVVLYRQSLLGALLHPFGVTALLAIQWQALARSIAGRPTTWKGRPQSSGAPAIPVVAEAVAP